MNLLRFDTVAYTPPARAEARFPVLAGQARCSTGTTIRGSGYGETPILVWAGKVFGPAEISECT